MAASSFDTRLIYILERSYCHTPLPRNDLDLAENGGEINYQFRTAQPELDPHSVRFVHLGHIAVKHCQVITQGQKSSCRNFLIQRAISSYKVHANACRRGPLADSAVALA
jgi:hypothetical protein